MKNQDKNLKLGRECISCRMQFSRDNLVRLMKIPGLGKLIVNPSKYQFGRSAYICKSGNCMRLAIKEKKILKVMKISPQILETVIPSLMEVPA